MYSVNMRKNPEKHLEQIRKWQNRHQQLRLPKEDYIFIKKYCDAHGLNLVKWLVITAKLEIEKLEQAPFNDLVD